MNDTIEEIEKFLTELLFAKSGKMLQDKNNINKTELRASIPYKLKPMHVSCPWVCLDSERIYALDPDLLLDDPLKLAGESIELLRHHGEGARWLGQRTYTGSRKGYITADPRDAIWIEQHQRIILPSGAEGYFGELAAWDPVGRKMWDVVPSNCARQLMSASTKQKVQASLRVMTVLASFAEDSKPFWHVEVRESTSVKTYAGEAAVKELADLRNAPMTPSGRRKAIIHWVAEHVRKLPSGKEAQVRKHLRGIESFEASGLSITITNPHK